MADTVQTSPELFFNRELSWLDFDDRVLQLAEDPATPLLERLKFCAIWSTNLDEFFMVRVAGLHDMVDAGIDSPGKDGLNAASTIERIRRVVARQYERVSRCLTDEIVPALADAGLRVVRLEDVEGDHRRDLEERFLRQVFPVLTPLAVGLGRPFPYISNLSLSLAVRVRDPVTGQELLARVKVPTEMLPRFMPVNGGCEFVPVEDVIAANLDELFEGMEILEWTLFRVTRDADFTVGDEADDLLQAVETELRRRRFGEVVRLEVQAGTSDEIRVQLVEALGVEAEDVFEIDGLMALGDLWGLYGVTGFSELRDPPWQSVTQPRLTPEEDAPPDVMAAMRRGDILVHHPYDSFTNSVQRLIEQAAEDDQVLAIKLTVYRTSDDTPLVPTLIRASERGKQAVCMVEIKARFDEQANVRWARKLEEAGVHVVYGLPALKTHAKCVLIVRREGDGVRHYVHVGTGNYHAKTARLYTDFGLFTCDPDIGADVADMFNGLTGFARQRSYRKVLVAPAFLREGILDQIEQTVQAHRDGLGGAHLDEDELAGRRRLHPRALRRLAGRRARRSQHPRHLLPAARSGGRQRQHPRRLRRRPLPRALAHLRLPAGRGLVGVDRLRGPDAAQPGHAGRAADADRRARAARRRARHPGALPGRQHARVGAGRRRRLDAARGPGGRAPLRAARADGSPLGARFGIIGAMKRLLLAAGAAALLIPAAAHAATDDTTLVNRIGTDGPVADGTSGNPSISDDGRLIAFFTAATNLGSGPGLYVKDMVAGTVQKVSSTTYVEQPRLSDNGHFVCFVGSAGRATVRDLAAGTDRTAGAASTSSGGPSDYDYSGRFCDVSDDGNRLVYASTASPPQVVLHDFAAGTDTIVSRATGADGAIGDAFSLAPAITPDGRFVLFRSRATNFSTEDADALSDVFLRDTTANTTTWVSRGDGPAGGVGTPNDVPANATSGSQAAEMSDDGRVVAFQSFVKGLEPGAPATPASAQVYVRDLAANTTRIAAVTRGPDGERVVSGANTNAPTISGDGTFVGFGSAFGSLDEVAPAPSSTEEIYVRGLAQDRTTLVSRASGVLGAAADQFSFGSMLSGDGRFQVFASDATNLGDPGYVGPPEFGRPAGRDIFVRQLDPVRPLVADLPGPPTVAAPTLLTAIPALVTPVADQPESPVVGTLVKALQKADSRRRPPAGATISAAARPPVAATLGLGEYGRVTLVVERLTAGRRKGSSCRAVRKVPKRKRQRCTRIRTLAKRTVSAYEGRQTVALAEVLGQQRLTRGTYRLRSVEVDLAGRPKASARTFRIR